MKNTVLFIVFAIFIAFCFMLFSGNDFIFLTLPGNIPLGNVIAAFCFILPSFGIYYFMNDIARFKNLRKISWITSCMWLPFSMALSGNLQLTFEGYSFGFWVIFSFVVSALIMFTLIHSIVYYIQNLRVRC
jgi:hypothetical protein